MESKDTFPVLPPNLGQGWEITSNFCGITDYGLHFGDFRLGITDYGLHFENFKIGITDYGLHFGNFRLRITDYRLHLSKS